MVSLHGMALFAVVLLMVSFINSAASYSVDPKTNFIVDDFGRVRIFHGVNAVEKIFPWYPEPNTFSPQRSLNADDARNLKHWGFNIVRLGTMWPGLEATRGSYNMTYLQQIRTIVNHLHQEGIVTLLDMHQDLLSPYWCGEGVPDWAAIARNLTFDFPKPAVWETIPKDPSTGYADLKTCLKWVFGVFYLSEAVNAGFQSLYDNVDGIQDSFVKFWDVVSRTFANHPGIIGYELINEPWAGNAFKDLWYLLSGGEGDRKNLAPMYDRAAAAIRSNLPSTAHQMIFYESATIDQVWGTKNGFTTGPGGSAYNHNNVYSYHSYCTLSDRDGNPYNRPLCDAIDSYLFSMWIETYKRLGGGGMMTEWGALSSSPGAMQQIERIAGLADDHLQSWIWWQFKDYDDVTTASIGDVESFYDSKGNLQIDKVKALSRSYAYAIAGVPTYMNFNPETADFNLKYTYNATIPSWVGTMVYINNEWHYPNGYKILTTPNAPFITHRIGFEDDNHLTFLHHGVADGTEVSITITRI